MNSENLNLIYNIKEIREKALEIHNILREEHSVNRLVIDDDLNNFSQKFFFWLLVFQFSTR